MKHFMMLLALSVFACGPLPKPSSAPVEGIYDVTSRVIRGECSGSNTPLVSRLTFELLNDDMINIVNYTTAVANPWNLYLCDGEYSDCRSVIPTFYAGSQNGYDFSTSGCSGPWCITQMFTAIYDTDDNGLTKLTGVSKLILTMPQYAQGSCEEDSQIDGVKR